MSGIMLTNTVTDVTRGRYNKNGR